MLEVHAVDAGDRRRARRGSRPTPRSCARPRSGARSTWARLASRMLVSRSRKLSSWSWTRSEVVVDVAEVGAHLGVDQVVLGRAARRSTGSTSGPVARWNCEHLALELVDALGRVAAPVREDLVLDLARCPPRARRSPGRSRRPPGRRSRAAPRRDRGRAARAAPRGARARRCSVAGLAVAHGDDEVVRRGRSGSRRAARPPRGRCSGRSSARRRPCRRRSRAWAAGGR